MKALKFILGALFIGSILSCNSSNNEPDYRGAFIGEYRGTRTSTHWTLGEPGSTTQVQEEITVTMVGDSSLDIGGTEVPIGIDGQFFGQGGASVSSYYSVEFFNGDSLITDQNSGGLGGGSRTTFRGKK